jgi:hypothetical protein
MLLPSIFRPMARSTRPPVTPGSVTYSTPGTYSFTVPNFNTLTATARGASGGGGSTGSWALDHADFGEGCNIWGVVNHLGGNPGGGGGLSSFNGSVVGNGGGGGGGPAAANNATGVAGTQGGASGGDTNTPGGGTSGAAGGPNECKVVDAGAYGTRCRGTGGTGGNGGLAQKSYSFGQLTPGSTITIVVGAKGGGAGGPGLPANSDPSCAGVYPVAGWYGTSASGNNGLDGSVTISWS